MIQKLIVAFGMLGGLLAIAGCGIVSAPVASSPPQHHTLHIKQTGQNMPLVVGAGPVRTIRLTPTKVINPPNDQQNEMFRAPLVSRTSMDTVRVSFSSTMVGTLSVTSAGGTVLWQVAHTGWAAVAEFGSRHLPVILTGSDQSFCGTGGCIYTAYTYNPARQQFVPVPLAPYLNLQYRLEGAQQ